MSFKIVEQNVRSDARNDIRILRISRCGIGCWRKMSMQIFCQITVCERN